MTASYYCIHHLFWYAFNIYSLLLYEKHPTTYLKSALNYSVLDTEVRHNLSDLGKC